MIANKSAFENLFHKWWKSRILLIVVLIVIGVLFSYESKFQDDITLTLLYWIISTLVLIRVFGVKAFHDFKSINQMVATLEVNQEVTFQTFPVSILFGLIHRPAITLTLPKMGLKVAETPANWPLRGSIMKSETNFAIIVEDRQFYLIRSLFDNSDLFDQCVYKLMNPE